jgi:hypothetical protein
MPSLGVDVDRDRPKPAQIWQGLAVFVQPPHVAAVLDNHVIEPIPISCVAGMSQPMDYGGAPSDVAKDA